MWKIALYGTGMYTAPDANSEVLLSSLSTTDPMTDVNWTKLDILGMGTKYEQYDEEGKRLGGFIVHHGASRYVFDVDLAPVKFPDDMPTITALKTLVEKKYIYLYKGTYEFTGDLSIHADNKALMVAITSTVEDSYEDGTKRVKLQIHKVIN